MKTRTLQILDEQYQQIDEGLWDRTKAKAAGIGSFLTAGSKRSEAYQNTAQSRLIDGKIAKIAKIISKLEDDIMKSTGLTMAEIQTKYPAIFDEIKKIRDSVSTTSPVPAPLPGPSPAPAPLPGPSPVPAPRPGPSPAPAPLPGPSPVPAPRPGPPTRPTPGDVEELEDEIERKRERGLDVTDEVKFYRYLVMQMATQGRGVQVYNNATGGAGGAGGYATGGAGGSATGGSVGDITNTSKANAAAAANAGDGTRTSTSRRSSTSPRKPAKPKPAKPSPRKPAEPRSRTSSSRSRTSSSRSRTSSSRSRTSSPGGGAIATITSESIAQQFNTMKYISYNDQELLSESYNSINAKQIILESSLDSFLYNDRPITTLSEAYAMLDIYNDLVEENIFAGLGALAGTAGRGLAAAGKGIAQGAQAVGQKVAQGAQAVGQKVAQGAQAVGQKAVQGAQAVGRGISTVGSNISNIYGTASSAADAAKVVATANQAANQLKELLSAAVAQNQELFKGGALGRGGDIGNQRLTDIINHLGKVQQSLSQQATQAQQRGFFGGVGAAMQGQPSGGAAPTGTPATP